MAARAPCAASCMPAVSWHCSLHLTCLPLLLARWRRYVDLGTGAQVTGLQIFSRDTCCQQWQTDLEIRLGDTLPGTYYVNLGTAITVNTVYAKYAGPPTSLSGVQVGSHRVVTAVVACADAGLTVGSDLARRLVGRSGQGRVACVACYTPCACIKIPGLSANRGNGNTCLCETPPRTSPPGLHPPRRSSPLIALAARGATCQFSGCRRCRIRSRIWACPRSRYTALLAANDPERPCVPSRRATFYHPRNPKPDARGTLPSFSCCFCFCRPIHLFVVNRPSFP